jgi:hypothetical protein
VKVPLDGRQKTRVRSPVHLATFPRLPRRVSHCPSHHLLVASTPV